MCIGFLGITILLYNEVSYTRIPSNEQRLYYDKTTPPYTPTPRDGGSSTNLFLIEDNVAIDENVIEEEELAWLGLLTAHLGEHPLAHQHTPWLAEWLSR